MNKSFSQASISCNSNTQRFCLISNHRMSRRNIKPCCLAYKRTLTSEIYALMQQCCKDHRIQSTRKKNSNRSKFLFSMTSICLHISIQNNPSITMSEKPQSNASTHPSKEEKGTREGKKEKKKIYHVEKENFRFSS